MLSVVILTRNEEKKIEKCILSIREIADEIILIDAFSKDKTVEIAERLNCKVFERNFTNFSDQRNFAIDMAKGDWVLYLDADEVATDSFKSGIIQAIKNYKENVSFNGYFIKRSNFFYGQDWHYIDKVQRLFYKKYLIGWQGKVHETPKVKGKFGEIFSPVLHFTHDDLERMVEKTNKWSEFEAEARIKANHPKMTVLRFIRVMATAFFNSYFKEGGIKNGTAGFIEAVYQSFSIFITYAKLWEKQK